MRGRKYARTARTVSARAVRRAICEGRRARRTVDSPLCRGVVCSNLCDLRPVQVLRRQRRKRREQITARVKVGGRAIFI